jgi:hypothetical protein
VTGSQIQLPVVITFCENCEHYRKLYLGYFICDLVRGPVDVPQDGSGFCEKAVPK